MFHSGIELFFSFSFFFSLVDSRRPPENFTKNSLIFSLRIKVGSFYLTGFKVDLKITG